MVDLSLVLPVHNEEDIIGPVVADIRKSLDTLKISYECILVENGSTDNSLASIRHLEKKYPHTKAIVSEKGYGSAVLAGLSKARGQYVSYMPSDGQIDPSILVALWKALKSGSVDMVKVKRVSRESTIRLIVSYVLSITTSLIYQIPFIDVNGTPRIFKRSLLPVLDLTYRDSFIDVEFAVKAHHLSITTLEVPLAILPRSGGVSTRNWRTYTEFIGNILAYRFGNDLKRWKSSVGRSST